MDHIKAILFATFLIIWTVVVSTLGVITFISFNSKFITTTVGGVWTIGINWYLKYICGILVEIEGVENLPKAPYIIASKHQSAWETCFFIRYFANPAFILKKELTYIPFYGWYLIVMGMISVERGSISAIKKINAKIRNVFQQNRVLVIFPEGTRVLPDTENDYKSGIYMIHKAAPEVPIVPVALNSGKFWPKGSFAMKPGVIKVKFLPALTGKYNKDELIQTLKKIIDQESNKL